LTDRDVISPGAVQKLRQNIFSLGTDGNEQWKKLDVASPALGDQTMTDQALQYMFAAVMTNRRTEINLLKAAVLFKHVFGETARPDAWKVMANTLQIVLKRQTACTVEDINSYDDYLDAFIGGAPRTERSTLTRDFFLRAWHPHIQEEYRYDVSGGGMSSPLVERILDHLSGEATRSRSTYEGSMPSPWPVAPKNKVSLGFARVANFSAIESAAIRVANEVPTSYTEHERTCCKLITSVFSVENSPFFSQDNTTSMFQWIRLYLHTEYETVKKAVARSDLQLIVTSTSQSANDSVKSLDVRTTYELTGKHATDIPRVAAFVFCTGLTALRSGVLLHHSADWSSQTNSYGKTSFRKALEGLKVQGTGDNKRSNAANVVFAIVTSYEERIEGVNARTRDAATNQRYGVSTTKIVTATNHFSQLLM
jgi:hypothetical protein